MKIQAYMIYRYNIKYKIYLIIFEQVDDKKIIFYLLFLKK